ncbi:MAG: VCBS repeat-containing protein [Mariniphaga sp.]|nr:VCBS repeat-containing protein [Mariniphaga sp.]
MKKTALIWLIAGCFLCSCNSKTISVEPRFVEKVLSDQAPQHLWTKSFGDVNMDGKTDILVGGWRSGGLVAYLAPDWEEYIINDSLKIGTDSEICDLNNDGTNDIVTIDDGNRKLIWLRGPDWQYQQIDSKTLHDAKVADFNNDGLLDIVARNQAEFGNRSGDTLYFYIQKPVGEWSKYTQPVVNGEGIKVADVNGNGRLDVIINQYWLENTGNISI